MDRVEVVEHAKECHNYDVELEKDVWKSEMFLPKEKIREVITELLLLNYDLNYEIIHTPMNQFVS